MEETRLTLTDYGEIKFDAYVNLELFGISIVQSDGSVVFRPIKRDDARRLQNFLTEFLIATR